MYTSKDRVRVMIITELYVIEGDVHVLVGSRLTDALDSRAKDVFSVTEVTIKQVVTDYVLFTPPYMAINRDAIHMIFEVDKAEQLAPRAAGS